MKLESIRSKLNVMLSIMDVVGRTQMQAKDCGVAKPLLDHLQKEIDKLEKKLQKAIEAARKKGVERAAMSAGHTPDPDEDIPEAPEATNG